MTRTIFHITLILLITALAAFAQGNVDDVHLFQNFYRDATIASSPYGEGFVNYSTYEYGSMFALGAQGGYGITPQLEVNANLGFTSFNPEYGDGSSGITDLTAAGRYLVLSQDALRITAGGFLTLPIGSEDIGQGNLNFGAFGATRYGLSNGMVITGTVGLDFYETTTYEYEGGGVDFVDGDLVYTEPEEKTKTEYKNSLVLAGGVIYPQSDQLSIIGEIMFKTDQDYGMLSGGVDYLLQNGGRVRGALGLGIDDAAPDFMILLSYLMSF